MLLNGQNGILIAPRRYGKTSLLNRVVDEVRAAGGRMGRVNLIRCSTAQDVAAALLTAVVHGPLAPVAGRVHEVVSYLRHLRVTPEVAFDPATGGIRGVRITSLETDTSWPW